IARARQQARGTTGSERVQFHVLRNSLEELPELFPGQRFHVLVLHAVLHHLSDEEVRRLMALFREEPAAPGATALILEPVLFREPGGKPTRLDRWVDRLILLPRMGRRLGLRRVNPREAELEQRIDGRGDSPKETPFLPGELEGLLAPELRVRGRRPVLCFSYLAAKNLLLFQVSHPALGRLLAWPYLAAVRCVERLVLRCAPGSVWYPLFFLFQCDLAPAATSIE
ncbi:MAG: class I SAM-dependent methyltransferase, partial [Actinomycetota bacterium]